MLKQRQRVFPIFCSAAVAAAMIWPASLVIGESSMTSPAPAVADDALPSPKDLLKAAVEAQGGEEAFKKIKPIRTKGKMRAAGFEISMDSHYMGTGQFLVKQSNPMMGEVRLGYDGEVGWVHEPQGGYRLLSDEEVSEIRSMSMTHDVVSRMKDEFHKMETVEKARFSGKQCYKVRMVHKAHDRSQYTFFDADTKRIAGVEISEETDFGPMSVTVTFGGWEKHGDVTMFTRTTMNQMGMEMVMELTDIEINKVDRSVFELPESVQRLAKERKASRQQSEEKDDDN